MNYDIHERFSEARKARKLSKAKVAEMMGLSRGVIDNIELKRVIDVKDLYINSFCDIAKINERWLRTGEGEMYKSNVEELADISAALYNAKDDALKDVAKKLLQLTPGQLKAIHDHVDGLILLQEKNGRT